MDPYGMWPRYLVFKFFRQLEDDGDDGDSGTGDDGDSGTGDDGDEGNSGTGDDGDSEPSEQIQVKWKIKKEWASLDPNYPVREFLLLYYF